MKTALMIREPELYLENIHRDLDNFIRDIFQPKMSLSKLMTWRPAIEVKQNDKEYIVKVQLPGIKKDNIIVDIDSDFMTITAETHEEKEEEKQEKRNEHLHLSEFRYGKYQRVISFDQPVKAEEAQADYQNGVLEVVVPKQNPTTTEFKRLTIK